MMEARLIFMAIVCLCIAQLAFANEQNLTFKSPKDQHRYVKLIKETRCLVCQNQSLFDSSSALASDMRQQIYSLVNSGQTDPAIRTYLRNRYGDSILFLPPLRPGTVLLWLGPIIMLVGAFFSLRRYLARQRFAASYYAC